MAYFQDELFGLQLSETGVVLAGSLVAKIKHAFPMRIMKGI